MTWTLILAPDWLQPLRDSLLTVNVIFQTVTKTKNRNSVEFFCDKVDVGEKLRIRDKSASD